MTLTTSISQIRQLGPCADGYRFALTGLPKEGEVTAAEARAAGCSFEDMAWYLSVQSKADPEIDRRFRMWKADVAAHVLHVFEVVFPGDDRPRVAIEAARHFADGNLVADILAMGCANAQHAEKMAFDAGQSRAGQAAAAARVCGDGRASWVVSRCAVEAVRENAAAEQTFQYDRLIEWFTGDDPAPLDFPA